MNKETNKLKMRSSNIELLRILAMLMIVVFHIVVHTVYPQLTDAESIAQFDNGLFNHPVFYKKLWILSTIFPFGKIGDTVFILISGYFSITKTQIDIGKIAKKLLLPLGFATVALMVASSVAHLAMPDVFIELIPLTNINSHSWFIGYYFLVMLIAALFLNRWLNNLDKGKYTAFLLAVFAVVSLAWIGNLLNNFADTLRVLAAGVFVYALGGYIRLYDPFGKIRTYALILVWVGVYALLYLSDYNTAALGIESFLQSKAATGFTPVLTNSFKDFSMPVIILGVSLFEFFKRVRLPASRVINYLASAAFMVYLLHDNKFFYSLWNTQDWITLLYRQPFLFILKIFVWGIAVYLIGVIMQTLFNALGWLCGKMKGAVLKKD